MLDAVTAADGVRFDRTEYDLGAGAGTRTGETLPDIGARGDPRARRDPARRRRRPDACPAACSSAGCCCGCGSSSTTTSTCARPAVPGRRRPRWPTRATIDFVVVREGTEGPYVGNGGAMRVGTPHEVATEVSVNTAFGVERVVRDAFARAAGPAAPASSRSCTSTTCSRYAGHLWRRTVERVGAGVPGRDRRLPARRRGDDLPGDRPGAVRRDRHRQPLRRHPHRPRRPPSPAASAWRPAATSTPTGRRRACSSRSTARRPTSRVRARPTRRRPCCRSACCCEHLGLHGGAPASAGGRGRHRRARPSDLRAPRGRRRHRCARRWLRPADRGRPAAARCSTVPDAPVRYRPCMSTMTDVT